jgi:hypothetical protein
MVVTRNVQLNGRGTVPRNFTGESSDKLCANGTIPMCLAAVSIITGCSIAMGESGVEVVGQFWGRRWQLQSHAGTASLHATFFLQRIAASHRSLEHASDLIDTIDAGAKTS